MTDYQALGAIVESLDRIALAIERGQQARQRRETPVSPYDLETLAKIKQSYFGNVLGLDSDAAYAVGWLIGFTARLLALLQEKEG